MQIDRQAAQRPGAERRTVVREVPPDVSWENGGIWLRAGMCPSWKDDGTFYDYDIYLTPADIERIVGAVVRKAAS